MIIFLTDLDHMIDRIELLRENTTALAQLTVASEYVFRQYCDKARQGAVTLARQISENVGSDPTAHSMGLLLGPEQQLADTLVSDCSDRGTLIATEFRPYTNQIPRALHRSEDAGLLSMMIMRRQRWETVSPVAASV